MRKKDKKDLVFDSSALVKFAIAEKGSKKVGYLLEKGSKKEINCLASTLSAFELITTLKRKNIRSAVKSVVFFEKIGSFIEPTLKIAKKAAFLKSRHTDLNLSMADAIILQTAI